MKPLAEIRNYDDLHRALRARVDEVNISRTAIDELSGLPDGYAGKLLGNAQVKKLGPLSMGALLQALGLKLHLVEDTDQSARMCERWKERQRVRPAA